MEYVLLVYGAAFVVTGAAFGLQARAAAAHGPVPRTALWLATAFALVHGAADWMQLSLFVEERKKVVFFGLERIATARLVLLACSFAILGAFGLALAMRPARRLLAALLPAAALSALAVAGAIALRVRGLDPGALASAETATRYLLGVPACAAAIIGLDCARRRLALEEWRSARYVWIATIAVAAYGFFTGLVVPASLVPPSNVLNLSSFASVTHMPVEIFRAASIAVVGLLLSEAFIRVTTDHLRSEVEHLRDRFVSLVAHDLRTPLGTIDAGATLLERLTPGEHASDREARILRAIRSSVRTMRRIVSDLVDASYVEAHRLSISPERLDVSELLLRLVEWAPADALRGHTVRLVPPGPLPPVLADPIRIEQVLENLLTNAGKYSSPGSEIVLEACADLAEVTVSVTNAGEGIPACDLPRVFSRNYRTRSAESGRKQGLGLGLYIAKGLVDAHGGRIWAESEIGRHTTFRFTLSFAPASETSFPPGDRAAAAVGEPFSPKSEHSP